MLNVKFFAKARDLVGAPEVQFPWVDGQTVAQLKVQLKDSCRQLAPLIPTLLVAVNNEYARDHVPLNSTDEVACFPPVSGG